MSLLDFPCLRGYLDVLHQETSFSYPLLEHTSPLHFSSLHSLTLLIQNYCIYHHNTSYQVSSDFHITHLPLYVEKLAVSMHNHSLMISMKLHKPRLCSPFHTFFVADILTIALDSNCAPEDEKTIFLLIVPFSSR